MGKNRPDVFILNTIGYFTTGCVAFFCLTPFILILSASFSQEQAILRDGFSILPRNFSLDAYATVFEKPEIIGRAYLVTTFLTITGTLMGLLITSMTGYVLQRKDFEWRNRFSFMFYFTTLFSGGLVPYYILMIRYLRLKDSYLALLLPLLFNVFNLIIMKSYMSGIPIAFTEAAIIDGCGDFSIYFKIMLPLSKPVLATVGLFIALTYWNDWYSSMLYINDESKYTLQYFLYERINNIEAYKKIIAQSGGQFGSIIELPTQTLRIVNSGCYRTNCFGMPVCAKYFKGITIEQLKAEVV